MEAHETLTLPPSPPTDRLPPEIRETVAAVGFDLTDGRSFLLRFDRGTLGLEERAGEADARLRCSAEEFHRILTGETNLLTALMRGDIRVTGNLEYAKRLYRYLRLSKSLRGQP